MDFMESYILFSGLLNIHFLWLQLNIALLKEMLHLEINFMHLNLIQSPFYVNVMMSPDLGSCQLCQFVANGWFRLLKESLSKVLANMILIWCCKSYHTTRLCKVLVTYYWSIIGKRFLCLKEATQLKQRSPPCSHTA